MVSRPLSVVTTRGAFRLKADATGDLIHPELQLAQLLWIHRRRGACHQVHGLRRLRKRDDLANRRLARQDRDDAIEAERDAAVRRCAVLERVDEEAEAELRLLLAHPQQLED